MEFNTLNELIEMPKKADASKTKKKLYVEQMVMLLMEEGISQKVIEYLKGGFAFAGSKPVAIYLQKIPIEQRSVEISKLLSSDLFCGGDKLVAFRFGVSLSAYSIEWFGDDQQVLKNLITVLPPISKNKDKQLFKDAPKILEKYFLDIISDTTRLPRIDVLGLRKTHIREYRKMMLEMIDKVSTNYKNKASCVAKWLDGGDIEYQVAISESIVTTDLEDKKQNNCEALAETSKNDFSKGEENSSAVENQSVSITSIDEEERTQDSSVKQIFPDTHKELKDVILHFDEFFSKFEATITEFIVLQRELESAKIHIYNMQQMIQQTEAQLSAARELNEQKTSELLSNEQLIEELYEKLKASKQHETDTEKKLEVTESENARLNSIISVYSSDKQNAQSEQLNSIASKLKSEYRDFKEVENDEMNIDLGENFRFQIQSIFKILTKAGVDVERR